MNKFTSRQVDRDPDLVVLNHGGGLQTGTIVEMIHDEILPKPDVVIAADTGDEPAYVYAQWQRDKSLLKDAGVPFLIVNNGNLIDDVYSGGRFAAMPLFTINKNGSRGNRQKTEKGQGALFEISEWEQEVPSTIVGFGLEAELVSDGKLRRQCTSEYKILPIEKELRIMLLEMGLAKETKSGAIRINSDVLVESWIGYTTDELQRVKDTQQNWQYFRFPLLEMKMSRGDCALWLENNGKPPRLSSACRCCPLISNARMRELRDNDPAGWEKRLKFDDDLRKGLLRLTASVKGELFLHPSKIPMRDVDVDGNKIMPELLCGNVGCMT